MFRVLHGFMRFSVNHPSHDCDLKFVNDVMIRVVHGFRDFSLNTLVM